MVVFKYSLLIYNKKLYHLKLKKVDSGFYVLDMCPSHIESSTSNVSNRHLQTMILNSLAIMPSLFSKLTKSIHRGSIHPYTSMW
jgi:hypothetical protein